jgi:hypothetical protein
MNIVLIFWVIVMKCSFFNIIGFKGLFRGDLEIWWTKLIFLFCFLNDSVTDDLYWQTVVVSKNILLGGPREGGGGGDEKSIIFLHKCLIENSCQDIFSGKVGDRIQAIKNQTVVPLTSNYNCVSCIRDTGRTRNLLMIFVLY